MFETIVFSEFFPISIIFMLFHRIITLYRKVAHEFHCSNLDLFSPRQEFSVTEKNKTNWPPFLKILVVLLFAFSMPGGFLCFTKFLLPNKTASFILVLQIEMPCTLKLKVYIIISNKCNKFFQQFI